jgi:hypothetical protein
MSRTTKLIQNPLKRSTNWLSKPKGAATYNQTSNTQLLRRRDQSRAKIGQKGYKYLWDSDDQFDDYISNLGLGGNLSNFKNLMDPVIYRSVILNAQKSLGTTAANLAKVAPEGQEEAIPTFGKRKRSQPELSAKERRKKVGQRARKTHEGGTRRKGESKKRGKVKRTREGLAEVFKRKEMEEDLRIGGFGKEAMAKESMKISFSNDANADLEKYKVDNQLRVSNNNRSEQGKREFLREKKSLRKFRQKHNSPEEKKEEEVEEEGLRVGAKLKTNYSDMSEDSPSSVKNRITRRIEQLKQKTEISYDVVKALLEELSLSPFDDDERMMLAEKIQDIVEGDGIEFIRKEL